jgi:hypothetical protein
MEVTAEKKSQTQGNLHQKFRMQRPTGINHIPGKKRAICLFCGLSTEYYWITTKEL